MFVLLFDLKRVLKYKNIHLIKEKYKNKRIIFLYIGYERRK